MITQLTSKFRMKEIRLEIQDQQAISDRMQRLERLALKLPIPIMIRIIEHKIKSYRAILMDQLNRIIQIVTKAVVGWLISIQKCLPYQRI
jgi:hypothetical protein